MSYRQSSPASAPVASAKGRSHTPGQSNYRFGRPVMEITINGEQRQLAAAQSLEALLQDLRIDPKKVAVERNLEIVPRSTYGTVQLTSGDRLEIVHFIGGGSPDGAESIDEGWS